MNIIARMKKIPDDSIDLVISQVPWGIFQNDETLFKFISEINRVEKDGITAWFHSDPQILGKREKDLFSHYLEWSAEQGYIIESEIQYELYDYIGDLDPAVVAKTLESKEFASKTQRRAIEKTILQYTKTNNSVLDPFATTSVVSDICRATNRLYIGF